MIQEKIQILGKVDMSRADNNLLKMDEAIRLKCFFLHPDLLSFRL